MHKVFDFSASNDFQSQDSYLFAQYLLSAERNTRNSILKTFGLDISTTSLRTIHDGTKVGFGSFSTNGTIVNFSISPKTSAVDLDSLLVALGNHLDLDNIRLQEQRLSVPTIQGAHTFTFALLLKLLQDIARASIHLFNASIEKDTITVTGGIRGRPLIARTLRYASLGKPQFIACEVLSHENLTDYATILCVTAESVFNKIQNLSPAFSALVANEMSLIRRVGLKFGILSHYQLNKSLLYKVVRPPFPFGLQGILYKCMQYWQWQGNYKINNVGIAKRGYWAVVIDIAMIFQSYVGNVWLESAKTLQLEKVAPKDTTYKVGNHKAASLRLDHLFYHRQEHTALILDAKYSNKVGDEQHIYQILSYLTHSYRQFSTNDVKTRKVGILVYPGHEWKLLEVLGFDCEAYCVTLPVQRSLYSQPIHDFVEHLITPRQPES